VLWDEELRQTNQRLLEASLALLHTWPPAPTQWHTRLQAYATTVAPLLERNLYAAAQDELGCLHRTVTQWRTTVLRSTWPWVFVVVCGSHQARHHELATRYFQTLWLLLDSRVVDVPMAYNPTFVTLSSLKPFFCNGLQNE
jgi:hypothetical protein